MNRFRLSEYGPQAIQVPTYDTISIASMQSASTDVTEIDRLCKSLKLHDNVPAQPGSDFHIDEKHIIKQLEAQLAATIVRIKTLESAYQEGLQVQESQDVDTQLAQVTENLQILGLDDVHGISDRASQEI